MEEEDYSAVLLFLSPVLLLVEAYKAQTVKLKLLRSLWLDPISQTSIGSLSPGRDPAADLLLLILLYFRPLSQDFLN